MKKEILKQFPQDIQLHVLGTLKAYDECHVERNNGVYSCYSSSCITSSYAEDHKVWRFNRDDVYTEKEQIENYINEFHSYPFEYNGKRDYNTIQLMSEKRYIARNEIKKEKGFYFDSYGEIDKNGNFQYKEIKKYKRYKNHCTL